MDRAHKRRRARSLSSPPLKFLMRGFSERGSALVQARCIAFVARAEARLREAAALATASRSSTSGAAAGEGAGARRDSRVVGVLHASLLLAPYGTPAALLTALHQLLPSPQDGSLPPTGELVVLYIARLHLLRPHLAASERVRQEAEGLSRLYHWLYEDHQRSLKGGRDGRELGGESPRRLHVRERAYHAVCRANVGARVGLGLGLGLGCRYGLCGRIKTSLASHSRPPTVLEHAHGASSSGSIWHLTIALKGRAARARRLFPKLTY